MYENFNLPIVKAARNAWHTAAIHTDWVKRFYGIEGILFKKAVEREMEAHNEYIKQYETHVRVLPE